MYFVKFPLLQFTKASPPAVFIQLQPRFCGKYGNQKVIQAIVECVWLFFCDLPNLNYLRYFEDTSPKLNCHSPQTYLGFQLAKDQADRKVPGPLVFS